MNKPLLLLALLGTTATAAVSFTHGDWQINCDNTHTCRIAGYQTITKIGRASCRERV